MPLHKSLLAAMGAVTLLAALVASASARSFSTSSQTLRATFRALRLTGPFGSATCQVTLEGSLHSRSIAKVTGSLIGYITAARLGPCAEGRATILRELLPWHIRYLSFSGTLPSITSLRFNIIEFNFRIQEAFGGCLAESEPLAPVIATFNSVGGTLTTLGISGRDIPTLCAGFPLLGSFSSDNGPLTILNSTARITVTLI